MPQSLLVLVVEDDPEIRATLETALRAACHTVCWAATALGAAEMIRTEPVELVILDHEIAGTMSGREVARHVPRGIPILLYSERSEREIRADAARDPLDGVLRFMKKPVDHAAVVAEIAGMLAIGDEDTQP